MLLPLRLRRYWLWQIILTGLAAALCFVPLFNLLGYEFSLAMAVGGSLAGLHLGSVLLAHARRQDEGMLLSLGESPRALLAMAGRAALAALSLLLLPLLVITLNALRVKNCDLLEGLAFYLVLPVISVTVAAATGTLWGTLTSRPWLSTLGAMSTLLASVAWGVYRFIDAPAIFAYDPFVGYFPGALYDGTVSVGGTLLLYRLHNLAWLAGALLLAAALFEPLDLRLRLRRPAGRWLLAAAPCLLLGLGMFLARGHIGFAISAEQVAAELGGVRQTEHFTIHYPREMAEADVVLLAQDHEFRHAQLKQYLGVSPASIRSFIFASSAQKRRLMGAGRTFVAKPWRREVYLQQRGFPHEVLKHELAHVFAGEFGDPLFGVSLRWEWAPLPHPRFSVGLIEGVAVAADWRPHDESTGHQYAAALKRLGLAPPLASLFGAGFLTHAPGRAYTLAGSFCRRLVELYGVEKLRRVYRSGGDFLGVYGLPLQTLLAAWSTWLEGQTVPPETLELCRERYRRRSIIRRVCGHEVASLIERADELMSSRRHDEALGVMARICSFEPGDPGNHLRLLHARVKARKLDLALAGARKLLDHPGMNGPLRRNVLTLMGDMSWWKGEAALAEVHYQKAAQLAAAPGSRRGLNLRLWGLNRGGETARLVQRYIAPAPDDPRDPGRDIFLAQGLQARIREGLQAGEEESSGLGYYLVAKQLRNGGHCDLATDPGGRAIKLDLPDQDFVIEAHLDLARCFHRLGRLNQAAGILQRLTRRIKQDGRVPRGGTVLQILDWQARLRWESGAAL